MQLGGYGFESQVSVGIVHCSHAGRTQPYKPSPLQTGGCIKVYANQTEDVTKSLIWPTNKETSSLKSSQISCLFSPLEDDLAGCDLIQKAFV